VLSQARQRNGNHRREHRDIILLRRPPVRPSHFFFFSFPSIFFISFFLASVALRPSEFELKENLAKRRERHSVRGHRGIAFRVRSYSVILSIRLSLHRPTFLFPAVSQVPHKLTNSPTHSLAHPHSLCSPIVLSPPSSLKPIKVTFTIATSPALNPFVQGFFS
jgi:hypothetical protein